MKGGLAWEKIGLLYFSKGLFDGTAAATESRHGGIGDGRGRTKRRSLYAADLLSLPSPFSR